MTPRGIRERAADEGIPASSTPGTKVISVHCAGYDAKRSRDDREKGR